MLLSVWSQLAKPLLHGTKMLPLTYHWKYVVRLISPSLYCSFVNPLYSDEFSHTY